MSVMSSQAYHRTTYDVIVIGGGNAGFSAATTAAQEGASVLLVEKAPELDAGGNTYFTAGAYRYCFGGLDDLKPLLYSEDGTKGVADDILGKVEIDPYTRDDFLHDLNRVTNGRADLQLAQVLVDESRNAVQWIADNGGKWHLSFHRQAYQVNGKYKFWGGMVTAFLGGGKALVEWHVDLAKRHNVDILWDTPVIDLYLDDAGVRVQGVEAIHGRQRRKYKALAGVIIACGGFQADPALRAQWLGPAWDLAHVRGSRYNTGDGHRMAARLGAKTAGHYSGCHSTCWDAQSPPYGGNRKMTNQYTKSGYPLGLMLNVNGERFVDEGFDLRNYTYAIFGQEVLKQPSGLAFQVWDANGAGWLRKEEYADSVTELIRADTIEALADALSAAGLKNRLQFCETIKNYNNCVQAFRQEQPELAFNPSIKDGLSTQSIQRRLILPKSNWALPLTEPPFTAVVVTCGITFTFGGLEVVPETAQVVSEATRTPIEGLYCCGELLGGLFYTNYPGGSGLTAGTVFGRIAGKHAAQSRGRASLRTDPE